MNLAPTEKIRPPKNLGRKKLYGRSYVVRQMGSADAGGAFRNLYDTTDGYDIHIANLQIGKNGAAGGLTVYRESVPSALIVWLIGLSA